MTADQFVSWLEGYLDCNGAAPLVPKDIEQIRSKMCEVDSRPAPKLDTSWLGGGIHTRGGTTLFGGPTAVAYAADPNVALCGATVATSTVTADSLGAGTLAVSDTPTGRAINVDWLPDPKQEAA